MAGVTRGINDRPVTTRTFYNSGNASLTPPSNVKLTNPNTVKPGEETSQFNLGNNIGAYFQSKNTQTPASSGMQKQFPTSNGVTSRGMGGADAISAAAQAAEGVGQGIQSSWNIGANASITNNWFNNISGVNGIYNGMHDRASMQAAAEQRSVDKVNNWSSTGKAVAGPVGMLAGSLLGRIMAPAWTKEETSKVNFKTLTDADQKKIDPQQAAISTAKVDPVLARNLAYGPTDDTKPAAPDQLRPSQGNNFQRMLQDPSQVQRGVAARNAAFGREGAEPSSHDTMSWDGYVPGLRPSSPDGSMRGVDELPHDDSISSGSGFAATDPNTALKTSMP